MTSSTTDPTPVSASLDRALEVEAFLDTCRTDGAGGALWRRTPDTESTPHNLYHGSAGIVLFYLELFDATGEERFRDVAISAGDELAQYVADTDTLTVGCYSGWPGYVFVLNELAKATAQARFRDAAKVALDKLMAQSQPLGAGIGWIEPMPFSDITGLTGDREVLDLSIGSAGVGLVLLYAHRQALDSRALGWAVQVADRLLEMSIDTPSGRNWLMMADMPFPFTAPNFAHGAAGVGYFLADLYRDTEEQRYLDAALDAAAYVKAKSVPVGDGELVCHTDENPGLFYLGVCHGPAGTGRFMYLLHEITEDPSWVDWVHHNMAGLLATGAPEARSDGLWNNYGQCCGDAGIGDFALSLYRATGDAQYLELARRIEAAVLATSSALGGRRSWGQAEHRNRPDFVEVQTGYMQGAAGLGSFLVHLATIDQLAPSKIALFDTPFTA